MKKILLCLLVLFMICGCSSKNDEPVIDDNDTDVITDDTDVVDINPEAFFETVKKGLDENKSYEEIANNLCDVDDTLNLVSMPVEPGYLNGFFNEIYGFEKGYVISPMIGSIPFIMYIMESEDTKNMEAIIGENKDMRWNICTEASDYYLESYQNTVFFMMYSNEN